MNLKQFIQLNKVKNKDTGFLLLITSSKIKTNNKIINKNIEMLGMKEYPFIEMYYEDYEIELIKLGYLTAPFFIEFTKNGEQNQFSLIESFEKL